jgi:hypothetical protein
MACPWAATACPGMAWCVPWFSKTCLGVFHGLPRHALVCRGFVISRHGMPICCHDLPWHALVVAPTSHGIPLFVPRATTSHLSASCLADGLPWHSLGCHGMHRCVPPLAFVGATASLVVCHGLAIGFHGLPWHALVCAMACPSMPWSDRGMPQPARARLSV